MTRLALLFAGGLLLISARGQTAAQSKTQPAAQTQTMTPEALFMRAAKFMEGEQYRYAVGDLNRVLRAEPNNARALAMRGTAQAKLQEYDKAYEDLSSAIKLSPRSPELYDARAGALEEAGRLREAQADRDEAAMLRGAPAPQAAPNANAVTPITIAPAGPAEVSGPGQAAGTAPAPATTAGPGVSTATTPAPEPAPKQKEPDAATARPPTVPPAAAPAARQPIPPPVLRAPDKASAAAHYKRARALLGENRFQGAVEELDQAIAADPVNAQYHNARGYAYQMLHDTRRALADLDLAIRLKPDYRNAYQNRAAARKAAGDAAGSAADLEKAKALGGK